MTLRLRLAALLALALVSAVLVTGFVGLQRMESALIDEVDDLVLSRIGTRAGAPGQAAGGANDDSSVTNGPVGEAPLADGSEFVDTDGRNVADYIVSSEGEIVREFPAGTFAEPLPQLDLEAVGFQEILEPTTFSSVDGTVRYRVLARMNLRGELRIAAGSLRSADNTIGEVQTTIAMTGLLAAMIGFVVGWVIIRRETRPIDDFLDTADAFAAGDLDARTEVDRPRSEIGRLGVGLNDAFDRVGDSVRSETEAKERLSAFVDDVAHELRTPATTIAGWAELYESGAITDPADVDRMVQRISGETARLAGLVDEMVLLARHDTVRESLLADVDVMEIVTDVIDDAIALDADREIRLHGTDDATVRGDRTRLVQVFANVLDNARVHTPDGTPVDVRIRRIGPVVEAAITDAGPGIPAGTIDRVFDRSFRAATAGARGRGLGLAIVKAIVEDHGGTITLTSREGEGTTVTITLPNG